MNNLELYKTFYYVAKAGSITAAAQQLSLTQPAVSQSMKQLEAQFLFHVGNVLAHGRLRDEALPRGAGKVQTLRRADEIFDPSYIHSKYLSFSQNTHGLNIP